MTRARALILLVVLPAVLACGDATMEDATATITVARGSMAVHVPADGTLEAKKAIPVAVPRVPTGALQVKALAFEGSLVEKGDVLVEFDDTQLSIDLDSHNASFEQSNRQLERTAIQAMIETGSIDSMREVAGLERDWADEFQLEDGDIYSGLEILESEITKDEAEATIVYADAALKLRGEYYDIEERILGVEKEQVEGNIKRVHASMGQLVLRAPISGLVVYRKGWRGNSVGIGDTLWPGNLIMSIVDPSSTELKAFVHEKDVAGIEKGARAEVRVDARPGEPYVGTVSSVAELARPIEQGSPVKYSEVKIAIEGEDRSALMPGMKASARIIVSEVDDVVIVPRSAVHGLPDTPFVLVRTLSGIEQRPVVLGPAGPVRVGVTEGLDGGERLVLGGDEPELLETPDEQPERVAAAGD